ncbi:MAG: cysteine hydrolase family protein [bacterium]
MKTLLWDVDTQKDFIEEDGRLAVDGADSIRENLKKITEHGRKEDLRIWGSADYHTPQDEEISDDPDLKETFPPHCLKDTDGWKRIPETKPEDPLWIDSDPLEAGDLEQRLKDQNSEIYFRKQNFDVFSNPNLDKALDQIDAFQVAIYGVTLDVCVNYAVEGFLERDYQVTVIEDATRAIDEVKREDLLFNWKNLGAQVIGTEEALSGYIL